MKVKLLLCSILLSIVIASCQKSELIYSCNPEADAWVKQNIKSTQLMSRNSWLKLEVDEETKRAVYISFSPETKRNFWQNKISEVIIQFNWSDMELAHLTLLLDYVNSTDALEKTGDNDDFDLFMYQWQEYGIDKLNWSKKLIYAIAASGDKLADKSGNITLSSTISTTKRVITKSEGGSPNYCTCSTNSVGCDPTGEFRQYCSSKVVCDIKKTGCGFLFVNECNGACRGMGTGD